MVTLTISNKGKVLTAQVARGEEKLKISLGGQSILITQTEAALLANFLGDSLEHINIDGGNKEIQEN